MRIQPKWVYSFIFVGLFLAGCQNSTRLDALAGTHDLVRSEIRGDPFDLLLLTSPQGQPGDSLHVYLGGDGRPWAGNQPAADPTGLYPLALHLMVQDPAPSVFLGRPCYHRDSMPPACQPVLWTSGRYSAIVVESMANALGQLLRERKPGELVLVGYSGGGALAVLIAPLLAEQLPVSVLTIAANLDTAAWTAHHRLLPLDASSNPAMQADHGINEVHLLGEEDEVVPESSVAGYALRHPGAHFVHVETFDHRCCWVEAWPQILPRALAALRAR